jgi:hypothetical protein
MHIRPTIKTVSFGLLPIFLLAVFASVAVAQSTDVAWPSPVRTNEVQGTIPARDLGDPRVTDHYYAFTGTPGDVLITIDSRNLDGDIDVFTLSGLRPLLKFTVYAGSSSATTKSIYLRKQEDLILRVEGRTPNDDAAVYRLHFGGAFEPITSGPLAEHEDAAQPLTTAEASSKGGRRVSATGARIEEPVVETAEKPQPAPSPVVSESGPKKAAPRTTSRITRTGRSTVRRTRPAPPPRAKPEETASKGDEEKKPATEAGETPTTPAVERPTRRGRNARAAAKTTPATPAPAPAETADSGPRLIIETADGTLVDRAMGGVRRVTVENGQVVVIGKDGKIQRIPLASVVRMTIAP